ncbi:MAG: hypothetical protein HZC40_02890 [Chloroflexi bacterium]|nr:hypothetical protein [Chloroflexota bacterium]
MSAKPVVDGLRDQYAQRVRVVRVDVTTPLGRDLGARYNFVFTPYFVGLDARGAVVWQQRGKPPSPAMLDQLASP